MKPVACRVLGQESGATHEINYNSLKSAKTAKTRLHERAFWERSLQTMKTDVRTPPGGSLGDIEIGIVRLR